MATMPRSRTRAPVLRRRLVLVDDHEIVREGLVAVLAQDPRFEIVGTASTGREAVELVRRTRPDIAILDLRLPDTPGDVLCRELRAQLPNLAVVVLSSSLTEESVRAALDAGASSYVTKAAGIAELRDALARTAPDADGCRTRMTVSQIVGRLQQFVEERVDDDAPTPQQARVLQLASEGLTYREIARRLVLSEATVRFHIQNLKVKYAATSKTDLVVRAIRQGLVTPGQEAGL
jgi:DNA-binding NarL/FixJ family response regulator